MAASSSAPGPTYTYYHGGPLFNMGELHTNVLLSQAILRLSHGKFVARLPQDLEPRAITPHVIRDTDLRALVGCDLALFTFDGSELDSGTVVEHIVAKMADIPSVLLRTDFRGGGDQGEGGQPWNLMSSFWPRSVGVTVNSMMEYKIKLAAMTAAGSADFETLGASIIEDTARKIIAGFEEAMHRPAKLPQELREHVYRWIALMPGYEDGEEGEEARMLASLKDKEAKGLFP